MLVATDHARRDRRVLHALRRVEHPQPQPGDHQVSQRGVQLGLGDQPLVHRGRQVREARAAVEVQPVLDRHRRGLCRRLGELVILVQVVDAAAIADDVPVEAPLLAENLLQQRRARAARLAVGAVVGAHDRLDAGLAHGRLERVQVRLPQVALRDDGVELVPQRLGPGVHRVVLGARGHLEVLRVVALEALDERHAHPGRQVRVLAVGLLAPAPARVAEDVDVRRPTRQAEVLLEEVLAARRVVLGAGLVGDRRRDPAHQRNVERRAQADRLREDRRQPRTRHAVEALVPPVVLRHAQPFDRGRLVPHLADLFLDRHPPDQIVRTLDQVQFRIQIRRLIRFVCHRVRSLHPRL